MNCYYLNNWLVFHEKVGRRNNAKLIVFITSFYKIVSDGIIWLSGIVSYRSIYNRLVEIMLLILLISLASSALTSLKVSSDTCDKFYHWSNYYQTFSWLKITWRCGCVPLFILRFKMYMGKIVYHTPGSRISWCVALFKLRHSLQLRYLPCFDFLN